MTIKFTVLFAAVAATAALAACGGGSSDLAPAPAPVAPAPGPAIPAPAPSPAPAPAPAGSAYLTRMPVTAVSAPTYAAGTFNLSAFNRLNTLRQSVGLGLFSQNDKLDVATAAHANYVKTNGNGDSHYETAGRAGYTGYSPIDRMVAAGYSSAYSSWAEDIAFFADGTNTVDQLINAIYHRIPLLQYKIKEIGIGFLQTSTDPDPRFNTYVSVFNLAYTGAGQGASAVPSVLWPADNSTTTSVSMPNELPRPGTPGASGVFGYPVSISVDEDRVLTPITFTLTDSSGAAVATNLISYSTDPNLVALNAKPFVAIVPKDPLKAATVYTVQFVGSLDSQPYSRTWSFRTP